MKLTGRGKDYLEASALAFIISVVAGPSVAAVLGMTLTSMACISLLLLRFKFSTSRASVEPSRLRMFKHTTRSAVLKVASLNSGFTRISSVSIVSPPGLAVEVGKLDHGAMELVFTPRYAGSFGNFTAVIGEADPLMLFAQTREVELDFAVEVLPMSLLLQDRQLTVSPMTYGEVPTGTRGPGQEHYDIEPYVPGSDASDLMWKRIGRYGEDDLLVKVREASMKSDVAIVVMMRANKLERRVVRTDLASEAIAQIGKRLTSLGVRVEILYSRNGKLEASTASNLVELTDAVVRSWSGDASGEEIKGALARGDLALLGTEDYDERSNRLLAGSKLALLIWDRSGRPDTRGRFFTFTGDDDLAPLAEAILEG